MSEMCDSKHKKLAFWIVGLVFGISVTISIGLTGVAMRDVPAMEIRMRQVEQQNTAMTERLRSIDERLSEIRNDVKSIKDKR